MTLRTDDSDNRGTLQPGHGMKPAPATDGIYQGLLHDQYHFFRKMQARYLDYPCKVHLETIAGCNATCSFCVYPGMQRKGQIMPDALIDKVIDDLTAIPKDLPFVLLPYKVSEPFLERRLFDILRRANDRLPNAHIELFSNGNVITEEKMLRLAEVRNLTKLIISLNYIDAEEYRAQMGLDLNRTLARLDMLHALVVAGRATFPVFLQRIGRMGDEADRRFAKWARQRYPAFDVRIIWTNDWIGDRAEAVDTIRSVPDAPCTRWFDFSVTATGKVAFCCMDGDAKYPKGDVASQHVLEIYNQPHLRALRTLGLSRRSTQDPCQRCTYLQSAAILKKKQSSIAPPPSSDDRP